MKTLMLYEAPPFAPVEQVGAAVLNSGCRECPLHAGVRNKSVCVPPQTDDVPGGLLLVGEGISREEDAAGNMLVGREGSKLVAAVRQHWNGPVTYDVALRCYAGSGKKDRQRLLKNVDKCRPYLSWSVQHSRPSRVVVLGSMAAYAVLGRSVSTTSVRRAYGWLGESRVPVFVLGVPPAGGVNPHSRAAFEEDMQWALTAPAPKPEHWGGLAYVMTPGDDVDEVERLMMAAQPVAFDTETTGRMYDPGRFRLLEVALCPSGSDDAWVWDEAALQDDKLRAGLKSILLRSRLIAHHAKFDRHAVKLGVGADLTVDNLDLDTDLVNKLLDADMDGGLDTCAEMIGMGGHKEEMRSVKAEGLAKARKEVKLAEKEGRPAFVDPIVAHGLAQDWKPDSFAYATCPGEVRSRYCARDAVSTAKLAVHLRKRLVEDEGITRVWRELSKPLAFTLAQMEEWGIAGSRDNIEAFARWCHVKQRKILETLSPYGINWNSPMQVADLLFGAGELANGMKKLGLPVSKETNTGKPSTGEEAIEALKGEHEVVDALLAWRSASKLRSVYADGGEAASPDDDFRPGNGGLLSWLCGDGRFHPSIKQNGTETGRPSAKDPNLFNIPRAEDEAGKMARDCFVAAEGHTLVECDMSQIELRIAAALSGDKKMIAIYQEGIDYHLRTAQLIAPLVWKMRPEDVAPDGKERSAAKTVNFSLVYFKGDPGLAAALGIPVSQAKTIREAILGEFSRYAKWCDEQKAYVRKHGYVRTWWGGPARRRPFPDILSDDREKRSHAERASVNTIVQGTASEFTLASLVEVVKWIKSTGKPIKAVLTVYDSIMLEVRDDLVDEVVKEVPRIMTSWPVPNNVPLVADVKTGKSWGSMQKLKKKG